MNAFFKSSEFWVGVLTLIGTGVTASGIIKPEDWNNFLYPALVYIVGRLTGKVAKALIH